MGTASAAGNRSAGMVAGGRPNVNPGMSRPSPSMNPGVGRADFGSISTMRGREFGPAMGMNGGGKIGGGPGMAGPGGGRPGGGPGRR